MEQRLLHFLKASAKFLLYFLLVVLVVSMLLGTADLLLLTWKKAAAPEPYAFLINVEELYSIFSSLLIIVVGYELFKSVILILQKETIPVKSIIKIAAIALANKVITLNLKSTSFDTMAGMSLVFLALGITFFAFNTEKLNSD